MKESSGFDDNFADEEMKEAGVAENPAKDSPTRKRLMSIVSEVGHDQLSAVPGKPNVAYEVMLEQTIKVVRYVI